MKIAACIIVKDDSEWDKLHNAILSLLPYVDNIYITTTGKETTKINKLPILTGVRISHLDWNDDFSAARNYNFSQVDKDTDYIFWMDSDDLLIGGENLRSLAEQSKNNGKDVVLLTYWYGCEFDGESIVENFRGVQMEHMRERLLKPGVTNWKGRLHETPVPVTGVKNNYSTYPYHQTERPVVIMHTSKDDEIPEKMERNQRLLELQLEDEKASKTGADPRTILYLMKIYSEKDDPTLWEKCEDMGKEYLQKSGWDEERGTCWEQIGIARGKMGDNKGAVAAFHDAIREWEKQPLFYIRLATAYYNINNYRAAEHWLNLASQMDLDNKGSNMTNFKAMKVLFAQLLLKLNYNAKRDTKKALEAARLLFKEEPKPEYEEQVKFLEDVDNMNEACRNVDQLAKYLDSVGANESIIKLLEALPTAITAQPFAQQIRRMFSAPRKWARNEICYFANFASKHFEQWSANSLAKGIGGSETAVIELAKQWTEMGYIVTVYGDPGEEEGSHEGVTYLPWYKFNKNDLFNIFIQWRGWQLAGKVKARKFLVDLHDIYSAVDLSTEQLQNIDKLMVKSYYHRQLAPTVPDEKFQIVSNGI